MFNVLRPFYYYKILSIFFSLNFRIIFFFINFANLIVFSIIFRRYFIQNANFFQTFYHFNGQISQSFQSNPQISSIGFEILGSYQKQIFHINVFCKSIYYSFFCSLTFVSLPKNLYFRDFLI